MGGKNPGVCMFVVNTAAIMRKWKKGWKIRPLFWKTRSFIEFIILLTIVLFGVSSLWFGYLIDWVKPEMI